MSPAIGTCRVRRESEAQQLYQLLAPLVAASYLSGWLIGAISGFSYGESSVT
jgi:hypothetical protein